MAFIPIDRNIFDHPFWTERREYSRFEAWIDLVKSAHYEVEPFRLKVNDQWVTVNRGQFAASIRFLQERWSWASTGKVKRYLDELETERMIERTTERKATLITLCKYDVYNPLRNADGTQNDTQTERKRNADGTKNNKVINKKRNKEDNAAGKPPRTEESSFSFFLTAYNDFLLVQTGHGEVFSIGGRAALVKIIDFLTTSIKVQNEKANIAQETKEIEARALQGWKYILNNYEFWGDPYFKKQLKAEQIHSNLTNILNQINKNGKGVANTGVSKVAGIKTDQAANFLNMEINVKRNN